MADFLGNSSDDDVDKSFDINEDYAARYDNWREKEEYEKLKARYGEDAALDHLSSSSSSESEDIPEDDLNDEDFFKTLSCLMSHDPKVYDKNVNFFKDEEKNIKASAAQKSKKEKPLFLKDYERKLIVEKDGILTDDESEDESNFKSKRSASPTYVEEQKQIKESFKTALEDSDDEGTFFTKRQKSKQELEKEESDYVAWLKGKKDDLNNESKKEMKSLHDYWNDPKLDRKEAYLRDYILNKKYLDEHDSNRIPAYDEIVHDSEASSEDEKTVQKQEEFEHKYNFRFEEPDTEFIKHYPRTMMDSMRRKDDARKKKRNEIKLRKEEAKERKLEELKQLKAMKRKEILQKLEKLKEITGNEVVGFKDKDIEGDFDPDAYDRRMQNIFNDDFYQMNCDDSKPEFPDDELEEDDVTENWDNWTRNDQYEDIDYEPHCEDPDFIMDADYNSRTTLQQDIQEMSKKKRRRKSHFAEILSEKKPVFNPDDATFEAYLDEYYKLDYEDLIDDLPCRFKYRKVIPNDFGLSVEEILGGDDKELNKWCSLKKTCQHRSQEAEEYDVQAYRKKAKNTDKKKKILISLYSETKDDKSKTEESVQENASVEDSEPRITSTEKSVHKTKKSKSKCEPKGSEMPTSKHKKIIQEDETSIVSMPKAENTQEDGDISKCNQKEVIGESRRIKRNKKKRLLKLQNGVENPIEANNPIKPISQNHNSQRKRNASNAFGVSDNRLRAYGFNPKKFKPGFKYNKQA